MNKIAVIGSGGAGKSTLSRKMSEILAIPVYHLDVYYWKPDWMPTDTEEWKQVQSDLMKKEHWIIDGNYGRTMDLRLAKADTIVFLDLSPWVTTYRVIKRRIMYHGKARPDMNQGCPERLREMSGGLTEGKTMDERISLWGENWKELDLGAEKPDDGMTRGLACVQEIVAKHPNDSVLIVRHGALLRNTLRGLSSELSDKERLNNTSITVLRHAESVWNCELYNCTKHLTI